jgi:hypothetical protein
MGVDFGLKVWTYVKKPKPEQQETDMALDLTSTETQQDPIPSGVYCLRARLKAGTAGLDGLLQRSKKKPALAASARAAARFSRHLSSQAFVKWVMTYQAFRMSDLTQSGNE